MNVSEAKIAFAAGDITAEAYVSLLEQDNGKLALRATQGSELRLKISEKGGLSFSIL